MYKSAYFFSSHIFNSPAFSLTFFELTHVYRQNDPIFIDLLGHIRHKTISSDQLNTINSQCYSADFSNNNPNTIYLTTTNKQVDMINQQNLNTIDFWLIYLKFV